MRQTSDQMGLLRQVAATGHTSFSTIQVYQEAVIKSTAPVSHDVLEFFLVKKGAGTLTVNGVDFPLSPGSMGRLFPFHIHQIHVPERRALEFYICRFPLSVLFHLDITQKHEYLHYFVMEHNTPVLRLEHESFIQMRRIMRDIIGEIRQEQPFYENMVLSGLFRVMAVYQREVARVYRDVEEKERGLGWDVLQYIFVYYGNIGNAAVVAEQFSITVPRLNQLLREMTGRNFSQNLNDVRIRVSCALLPYRQLTISKISRYLGYNSIGTFYHAFKQSKGMTPERFREGAAKNTFSGSDVGQDIAWVVFVYILEHYRENLDVGSVAEALQIGSKAIVTSLHENFGMGFGKLLDQARIHFACGLLGLLDISVAEVAEAVGFQSVRTFSRSFLQELGTSPLRYRQHVRYYRKEQTNTGQVLEA